MAFILESTDDGAATIVRNEIPMTDSEAGLYGEGVVATTAALTKVAATAAPQFILKKATAAGTGVATEYVAVRRDQIWLADITNGAASLVAAVIGNKVIRVNAAGTGIDAGALTGGKCEIISVDTVTSKARVRFDL